MRSQDRIIKDKVRLLALAERLGNISQACEAMGYGRDSFYRIRELYEAGGEAALSQLTHRKVNLKNRVDRAIEEAIIALAIEEPTLGRSRVASEMKKLGLTVSAAGVVCVWQRHDLETKTKRLKALHAKYARGEVVLTKSQIAALQKARIGASGDDLPNAIFA